MPLNTEQIADLAENFKTITESGAGYIDKAEVQAALKICGLDVPGFQYRELADKWRLPEQVSIARFGEIYSELKSEKDQQVNRWKSRIGSVTGAYTIASEKQDMTVHTIRLEEEVAFANWINSNLSADPDLAKLLPVILEGGDLYHKIEDGLIICKLINLAVPGTVDERAINKKNLNTYRKLENLTLALMSAQAIGCNIVNIDNHDLAKGTPHLVLGLLWQIIRIGLFSQIDLKHVPGLFRLLREGETLDDLRRLSPEEILMRWVNYHLQNAGIDRRLRNFTSDIMDSEIYTHLLHQIAPRHAGVTLSPLQRVGNVDRAGAMLCEAEKLDCREFVTPNDVAAGNYKLNLAFVANLFNKHPNLPEPGADEMVDMEEVVEETREEKTYRNWMNSMGVDPYVNWLYSDLMNGLVIFQLYDIIRPGIVNWKRVVKVFKKLSGMMDAIQNCNYAVELGKQLRFSLVGIQGKDIYDGNQTLTLALVWQLMRAYTLTILAQCTQSGDALPADKDIIQWVNQKLESSGKQSRIKSFQDPSISNAKVVLDLVDAIKPDTIDWSLVRDDSMENAKYAITCARKIGAKVYALPEDIVEVKPKMVLTVFACLMARDFMPNMRDPVAAPTYTH
ncbi:plst-1 [Pristionchus pacificus]|uniref:Plst-1 n=1 Tax=Pristionchus pacificus TaxID=54126 RepID=A0A2A6BI66_PRIPA|nr:plst-1 [Pristionchus pacificus]|eukprot:PDM65567.1 plst-1 [Pristionchus pacificus]